MIDDDEHLTLCDLKDYKPENPNLLWLSSLRVKSRGFREERQGFWIEVSMRSEHATKVLRQSVLPVASATALQSLGAQKVSVIAKPNRFHTAF